MGIESDGPEGRSQESNRELPGGDESDPEPVNIHDLHVCQPSSTTGGQSGNGDDLHITMDSRGHNEDHGPKVPCDAEHNPIRDHGSPRHPDSLRDNDNGDGHQVASDSSPPRLEVARQMVFGGDHSRHSGIMPSGCGIRCCGPRVGARLETGRDCPSQSRGHIGRYDHREGEGPENPSNPTYALGGRDPRELDGHSERDGPIHSSHARSQRGPDLQAWGRAAPIPTSEHLRDSEPSRAKDENAPVDSRSPEELRPGAISSDKRPLSRSRPAKARVLGSDPRLHRGRPRGRTEGDGRPGCKKGLDNTIDYGTSNRTAEIRLSQRNRLAEFEKVRSGREKLYEALLRMENPETGILEEHLAGVFS